MADNIRVRVAGVNTLNSDNTDPFLLGGKSGEAIVSELHEKLYTSSVRGNVFVGNSAVAGAVTPIYSNTTQQYGIFNPLGSGVNIVPVQLNFTFIDTTGAAGGYCLGVVRSCGASIATGSPGITAATTSTPLSLRLDGSAAKGIFMSAGVTTAAPTLLMHLGVNQLVTTAATTTAVPFNFQYNFDGKLVIPPGNAIFAAGVIAVLNKLAISLVWEEVPAF